MEVPKKYFLPYLIWKMLTNCKKKFSQNSTKDRIIPLCIPLRGNIPLGGNICYKLMKIEKINFKSIKI